MKVQALLVLALFAAAGSADPNNKGDKRRQKATPRQGKKLPWGAECEAGTKCQTGFCVRSVKEQNEMDARKDDGIPKSYCRKHTDNLASF